MLYVSRLDQTTAMFATKMTTNTKITLMKAALHKNLNPSPQKQWTPPDMAVDPIRDLIDWLRERMVGTLSDEDMNKTSHHVRYSVLRFIWDLTKLTAKRVPKGKQIMVFAEPDAGM